MRYSCHMLLSLALVLGSQLNVIADEPSPEQTRADENTSGGNLEKDIPSNSNTSSSSSSFESSSSSSSTSSSSFSSSSSSSSSSPPGCFPGGTSQSTNITGTSSPPRNNAVFGGPNTEKPSIKFVPKFRQRINDLGEQIQMARSKGFITDAEASQFLDRKTKLLDVEAEANKKAFPKDDIDSLEKAITLLNSDLFKAMRKTDPVKPGQADKEVNDPHLIPAYPDPELQPGSGKVDKPNID